jgi:predicted transcriptional regulator
MLPSQSTIAVRQTPDREAPTVIKTKTEWNNRYTSAYEDAMADLMRKEARAANARMQGGGAWDNMQKNEAVGRSMGYRQAVLDYLKENPGWKDRRTIAANVDMPDDGLSNALHGLVTSKALVKRIVQGGAGTSGRLGQWRIAKGADISPKALRRTNRQRLQLALTDQWQTTAQLAAKTGLNAEQARRALLSITSCGDASRDYVDQKQGGKKAIWRKAGAEKRREMKTAVEHLLSILDGGEWLTLRQIADKIETWSDKRLQSQLSTQVSIGVLQKRLEVIGGRKKTQWRRKEGGE